MVRESQTLRTLLFSAWLLLVVGVVVALASEDRFAAESHRPVATLRGAKGGVQVRGAGLARWRDAVERQVLYDGDRIAVGLGGKATVSFKAGSGRSVDLGENTQVQIRTISAGSRDAAYLITLIRGAVVGVVKSGCAKCAEMMIRAGDATYNVTPGSKVGVVRPVGGSSRRFVPKASWEGSSFKPTVSPEQQPSR